MSGGSQRINQNDDYVVCLRSTNDCKKFGRVVAQHWLDRRSLPLIDSELSMAYALIVRDAFLSHIKQVAGEPAGYKVAAITPPAQRDLGIREPLGAIYLAGMFRSAGEGISIEANYGARPIVEAKLMAIVGDVAINNAHTPDEIAKSISYLNPSIELGDSLAHRNQPMTGAVLTTYNVGTRCILTGPLLPFSGTSEQILELEKMVVSTHDMNLGVELERLGAEVMMGSPLNAISWLVQYQKAQGVQLRIGDRLGLGAMSRVRPDAGQSITTIWQGLQPEPVEVEVSFS